MKEGRKAGCEEGRGKEDREVERKKELQEPNYKKKKNETVTIPSKSYVADFNPSHLFFLCPSPLTPFICLFPLTLYSTIARYIHLPTYFR